MAHVGSWCSRVALSLFLSLSPHHGLHRSVTGPPPEAPHTPLATRAIHHTWTALSLLGPSAPGVTCWSATWCCLQCSRNFAWNVLGSLLPVTLPVRYLTVAAPLVWDNRGRIFPSEIPGALPEGGPLCIARKVLLVRYLERSLKAT